jgi:hypothetical protein
MAELRIEGDTSSRVNAAAQQYVDLHYVNLTGTPKMAGIAGKSGNNTREISAFEKHT